MRKHGSQAIRFELRKTALVRQTLIVGHLQAIAKRDNLTIPEAVAYLSSPRGPRFGHGHPRKP